MSKWLPIAYRSGIGSRTNELSSNNAAGAFDSPLKLPVGGFRLYSTGVLINVGPAVTIGQRRDGTYSQGV